ncbi:hypothetical protein FRC10_012261 [Ceratobasidium sp. 414]|nr:hypothetical protein FRC10_012261 [Ceratobasidium sp. 414]
MQGWKRSPSPTRHPTPTETVKLNRGRENVPTQVLSDDETTLGRAEGAHSGADGRPALFSSLEHADAVDQTGFARVRSEDCRVVALLQFVDMVPEDDSAVLMSQTQSEIARLILQLNRARRECDRLEAANKDLLDESIRVEYLCSLAFDAEAHFQSEYIQLQERVRQADQARQVMTWKEKGLDK